MDNSISYKPYGSYECIHLGSNVNEPCWGEVSLVDVDTIEDEHGDCIDESVYYACEGHAPMFPLSVLFPMGKYLPEPEPEPGESK